jgi:DNA-binding MarR family transcriptional regulator
VRRNDSLVEIERSIGRIGVVGSSVRAVRWRAARAGVEVSAPGMGILGVLERDGPQRVWLIARKAGMVGPQASRELRALEAAGYVERTTDGTDRRSVVVSINPKGTDAYLRLRDAAVAAAGAALAGWSSEELAKLARLLGRMADDFTAVAHE